jgi:hypothetical protein
MQTTMKFTIGRFDPADGQVPVRFTDNGFEHRRRVTAVLTAAGKYDAAATRLRVESVARGVERKRAAGAFAVPED